MMKAISALYLAAPTAAYWSTVGSGCCANMQGIPASTKIFDRPPNGDCLTQCQNMGAGLAVVFPNGKWCTCLHDFAVSQCQPLCANQGCCGSSGAGVTTYMWNSQSAQLSSNVSANVCGGSAAPQVHDCFADGHQKCNACPGNGKTCGGSFPVDCVSTAGNAGCEASPDAPGTAACANDDKGQCCYVLPPPAPAPVSSSANVSPTPCGGSKAPVVHDCLAAGHQKCGACPGNGKTCGGSFPVSCWSTAGNGGCESSPDTIDNACALDDKGVCCYVQAPAVSTIV